MFTASFARYFVHYECSTLKDVDHQRPMAAQSEVEGDPAYQP